MNKNVKTILTILIGSVFYALLSFIQIPLGANVHFRISIALLTIMGAFFGPLVGFFVGFIGHFLHDFLSQEGIWWSWTLLSGILGLTQGIIFNDKSFDIKTGIIKKIHVSKMYSYTFIGIVIASVIVLVGDVFIFGHEMQLVLLKLLIANLSNFFVVAIIGIPVVLLIGMQNKYWLKFATEEKN